MINNKDNIKQRLLRPKQIAEFLNCKPSTIYAWAKAGKIPSYKVCGLLRFDATEVEEWISNSKTKPALPLKSTPKRSGSNEVNDFIQRAIASVKGQSYNGSKGKPDQDQTQEGGK